MTRTEKKTNYDVSVEGIHHFYRLPQTYRRTGWKCGRSKFKNGKTDRNQSHLCFLLTRFTWLGFTYYVVCYAHMGYKPVVAAVKSGLVLNRGILRQ